MAFSRKHWRKIVCTRLARITLLLAPRMQSPRSFWLDVSCYIHFLTPTIDHVSFARSNVCDGWGKIPKPSGSSSRDVRSH